MQTNCPISDWPLPLGLVLGQAYVEERPAGVDRFTMKMTLIHPLFGELFRYDGRFTVDPDHTTAPAPKAGVQPACDQES